MTEGKYCAVHIRRGDYISDAGAAQTLGTLPLAYYHEALGKMRSIGVTRFLVFTDDRPWAADCFVSGNIGVELAPLGSELDDFSGIVRADAVIIANSSFSWWAAFAGDSSGREVVAPKTWFHDDSLDSSRLVPDRWTRLGE
jgi:hypothetical protein